MTSFTSRIVPALANAQVVEAEFIESIYAPTAEDLAWLEGRDHRCCGWVRHRLHLPSLKRRPVVFFLYGPSCEIVEEDGELWYRWAPLPEGFDPDLGLYVDLDDMLVERLGRYSVADCARCTLVPARVVEIIRDCLDAWHRDAMRLGAARPRQIAVTRVSLQGDAAARSHHLRGGARGAAGPRWGYGALGGGCRVGARGPGAVPVWLQRPALSSWSSGYRALPTPD